MGESREVPVAGKLAWLIAVVAIGATMIGLQPAGWARAAIVLLTLSWGIGGWLAFRRTRRTAQVAAAAFGLLALLASVVVVVLPLAGDSNSEAAGVASTDADPCSPYVGPDAGTFGCIRLRNAASKGELARSVESSPSRATEVVVSYRNTINLTQENVVVRVTLPSGINYVEGSSVLANASYPTGASISDNVVASGINIGSYTPGSNAWVRFSVTAGPDEDWQCGKSNRSIGMDLETGAGKRHDEAVVVVGRTC